MNENLRMFERIVTLQKAGSAGTLLFIAFGAPLFIP